MVSGCLKRGRRWPKLQTRENTKTVQSLHHIRKTVGIQCAQHVSVHGYSFQKSHYHALCLTGQLGEKFTARLSRIIFTNYNITGPSHASCAWVCSSFGPLFPPSSQSIVISNVIDFLFSKACGANGHRTGELFVTLNSSRLRFTEIHEFKEAIQLKQSPL